MRDETVQVVVRARPSVVQGRTSLRLSPEDGTISIDTGDSTTAAFKFDTVAPSNASQVFSAFCVLIGMPQLASLAWL
jgi:hypothetical protein